MGRSHYCRARQGKRLQVNGHRKFRPSVSLYILLLYLYFRQKIDEAPTPYRYLSESDQSEAESSDGESLFRRRRSLSGNAEEDSHNSSFHSTTGPKGTSIQDSWQALSAKLHYEKHLQDLGGEGGAASGGGKVDTDDTYSDFGEVVPPVSNNSKGNAPIRPAMKKSSHGHPHPPFTASPSKQRMQDKKMHKSVHIHMLNEPTEEGVGEVAGEGAGTNGAVAAVDNELAGAASSSSSGAHDIFAGISNNSGMFGHFSSHSPDPSVSGVGQGAQAEHALPNGGSVDAGEHKVFLSKRAGHYNEFKVLQAMRAKMLEEEDEEDEEGGSVVTTSTDTHSTHNMGGVEDAGGCYEADISMDT